MDVLGYLGASFDVLGALGASLGRFFGVLGCTWVCILTLLFWYVFTQGYLDPVRARAPPCASARACTRLYAPVRASFTQLLRFLALLVALRLCRVVPWALLGFLGSLL